MFHTYVLHLILLLQGTEVIGITVCFWMMHEGHIFHIPKLTTHTQTRTSTHRGKHPGDIFFRSFSLFDVRNCVGSP